MNPSKQKRTNSRGHSTKCFQDGSLLVRMFGSQCAKRKDETTPDNSQTKKEVCDRFEMLAAATIRQAYQSSSHFADARVEQTRVMCKDTKTTYSLNATT